MDQLSIRNSIVIALLLTLVANGVPAYREGRSVAGWVMLGLLFNPIALIVPLLLRGRALSWPWRQTR